MNLLNSHNFLILLTIGENMEPNISSGMPSGTSGIEQPTISIIEEDSKKAQIGITPDQISQSTLAKLFINYLANSPQLSPPKDSTNSITGNSGSITPTTLDMQFQLGLSKIILNCLDQWNEALHAEADRIAEKIRSPDYQAFLKIQSSSYQSKIQNEASSVQEQAIRNSSEFQAYIASLQRDHTMINQLSDGINNLKNSVEKGDFSPAGLAAVGGALMFGLPPAFAASISIPVSEVSRITASSTVETTSLERSITQGASPTSSNLAAELGLIGALFMTGVGNKTTVEVFKEMTPRTPKEVDMAFAKDYGNTLLAMAAGQEINILVAGMMQGQLKTVPKNEQQKLINAQAARVKIILLASFMALLYKLQTGGITAGEYNSLVDKSMDSSHLPNDVKGLHDQVADMLNKLQSDLPENEKGLLTNTLNAFMNTDPGLSELLQPSRLLVGNLPNPVPSQTTA